VVRIRLLALRWKMRIMAWLDRAFPKAPEPGLWHKDRLSVVCLYVFIVFVWYWSLNIPSPGKAVTALAVAAAVMSLRGEMGGAEKLAWLLLLFGLLRVELTSIDTERTVSETLRSQARQQEAESFRKIGEGITGSIRQSQRQFQATMGRSNKILGRVNTSIREQMGGDSYVVVIAVPHVGDQNMLAVGVNLCAKCTDSLPNAHIFMYRIKPTITAQELLLDGTVDAGYYQYPKLITPSRTEESEYVVDVYARNKPTTEVLAIRFNVQKNAWEYSYRIARQVIMPHYNSATGLAEGLVAKQLEFQPWVAPVLTSVDPKKMKVLGSSN